MYAIRQIQEVENGKIVIDLPADFTAQRVEVIVLPAPEMNGHPEAIKEDPQGEIEVPSYIRSFLELDTTHFTEAQLKAYERSCALLRTKRKPNEPRVFGLFTGLGEIADDFNELPEEYIDLFYESNLEPLGEQS